MGLKLLLVSVDGTLCRNGQLNPGIVKDIGALFRQLASDGVHCALWSNRKWTFAGVPLDQYFTRLAGVNIRVHGVANDGSPSRTRRDSASGIIANYEVSRIETVLIGSSENDLRAGVNNKLLLIRADWYGQQMDYGFRVQHVSELARFCYVFAMRAHSIFWRVQNAITGLDVSAAGPFSTMIDRYAVFGGDARAFAKYGAGHPDFWFQFTVSSIYFSGLLDDINYICRYPGHDPGVNTDDRGLGDTLVRLGQCFQIGYYEDLLVRHVVAPKSQLTRAASRKFITQLQSIYINSSPTRNRGAQPNKNRLSLHGKRVLVVDDFCTSGRSAEAARAYLQAAGADVRIYAWLKTINVPYQEMNSVTGIQPYSPNAFTTEPASTSHGYQAGIVDHQAPNEIQAIFDRYKAWKWP